MRWIWETCVIDPSLEQREVDLQYKCKIWGREAKMYRLVQIQSFWVDRKGGINSNIALTWNRSRRYHSISSLKHNSFRTVWISDSWIIQSLISLLYSSPCFQIELDVIANRFSTVLFFLRWHLKIKKETNPDGTLFLSDIDAVRIED